MPFKSEKQRRLLWAKNPALARRWTKKYGPTPESHHGKNKKDDKKSQAAVMRKSREIRGRESL